MSERRTFTFPFREHVVEIAYLQRQTHTLDGVGVALWPACCALSTYLANVYGEDFFRGKRVIELGSGAGLLGIALAKLGAEVTLTDASFATGALELLRENVQLNLGVGDDKVRESDQVRSRLCRVSSLLHFLTVPLNFAYDRIWENKFK